MKSADVRQLAVPELKKRIRDTRDDLVKLRVRKQSDQIERPSEFKEMRRDIARMETILREKLSAETATA